MATKQTPVPSKPFWDNVLNFNLALEFLLKKNLD